MMNNKVKGYKAFNNMKDKFGNEYELDMTYVSPVKDGFHFCGHIADVFRYYDGFDDNTMICEVMGFEDLNRYDDETYDYLDMYESTKLKITKALSREEVLEAAFNDGFMSTLRLISGYKLTDEEMELILSKHNEPIVKEYINYYQRNDEKAFTRSRKQHYD